MQLTCTFQSYNSIYLHLQGCSCNLSTEIRKGTRKRKATSTTIRALRQLWRSKSCSKQTLELRWTMVQVHLSTLAEACWSEWKGLRKSMRGILWLQNCDNGELDWTTKRLLQPSVHMNISKSNLHIYLIHRLCSKPLPLQALALKLYTAPFQRNSCYL